MSGNMSGFFGTCPKRFLVNQRKGKEMKTSRMRVGSTILVCLALGGGGVAVADNLLTQPFTQTTAPGWSVGGDAFLTAPSLDTAGSGWLRLTPNDNSQAGYAIYNTAIPATNGIQVAFDFNCWGGGGGGFDGNPADGIVLAIIDANHPPSGPGATGGAIGYAQNTGPNESLHNGLVGGMLGIALDEYGNFSRVTEGRPGGTAGRNPYTVSIRGPGDGSANTVVTAPSGAGNFPNYNLLFTSVTLPSGDLVPQPNAISRPSGVDVRHAVINFDMSDIANGHAYAGVAIYDGNGTLLTIACANQDVGAGLIGWFGAGNVPANFEVSLTSGTGGDENTHEVRNLTVGPAVPAGSFGVTTATLTIQSAHGIPNPTTGVYTNNINTVLTNTVTSPDVQGTTRYVCTGWTMTGNEPVGGTATTMEMTLTNNAVLTWNWRTEYDLSIIQPDIHLHVDTITNATSGWKPAGNSYYLYPSNAVGYAFNHWVVNGVSAGAGVPLTVTMDGPKVVTAVYIPVFVNVASLGSQVDWNVDWVFNPRLGYFLGTLTISNRPNSAKALLAPFWYEVGADEFHWLRSPTGVDAGTGLAYLDVSAAINSQLPGIGDHDLYLDPGESVTVSNIALMGRRTPDTNLVVAVWADPPGALIKPVDTDGDGVPDVAEYIAGTSATSSNDAFRIRLGSDGRSVQWDGKRSRLYTVYATTNLAKGFAPVGDNIEGSGSPTTYRPDSNVLGAGGGGAPGAVFYRVNVRVKENLK